MADISVLNTSNDLSGKTILTAENDYTITGTHTFNQTPNINDGLQFPATQAASTDPNNLDDYEEGSFVGTLTGVSGTVTVTVNYTKVGNKITMDVPQLSGTSNATTKTLTGMPAAIRPTLEKAFLFLASDNGGATVASQGRIATSGVITLYATTAAGAWTASGTALAVAFQVPYTLA